MAGYTCEHHLFTSTSATDTTPIYLHIHALPNPHIHSSTSAYICACTHTHTHTVMCPMPVSPHSCTRYGTQSDTVHLLRHYSTSQTLESPFSDCSRPQNYVHCKYSCGLCKVYCKDLCCWVFYPCYCFLHSHQQQLIIIQTFWPPCSSPHQWYMQITKHTTFKSTSQRWR